MTPVKFLFLADCQLGAYATFSGMTAEDVAGYAARDMVVESVPKVEGFEWDADRYAAAIAVANRIRPDFVVVGGDMIDDPAKPDQVAALLEITSRLDHDIPMRWVPGNHDIATDFVAPTHDDVAHYREVFGPDYYSFDYEGTRFVVMNTVVIDHPELVESELTAQMEWLSDVLSESAGRVVLIGHHPLFLKSPGEPDTYWNLPTSRRLTILEWAHRADVRLVLAGHWHRNSLARDGDLEMVTSGPVGYPLGSDPSGYRIVEISDAGIEHRYEALAI